MVNQLTEIVERCMEMRPAMKNGKPIMTKTLEGEVAVMGAFAPREATRALELLGKEVGMFVDRREQGRPGEFAGMSDEQLDAEIRQKLLARDLTEDQARAFLAAGRESKGQA